MSNQFQPIQKIIFGSPGTGKSYKIRNIAKEKLGIEFDELTNWTLDKKGYSRVSLANKIR